MADNVEFNPIKLLTDALLSYSPIVALKAVPLVFAVRKGETEITSQKGMSYTTAQNVARRYAEFLIRKKGLRWNTPSNQPSPFGIAVHVRSELDGATYAAEKYIDSQKSTKWLRPKTIWEKFIPLFH